jgi:hypothetical protein
LCSTDANSSCASDTVQPDGRWTLFAPDLGDGVTTTLTFVGNDVAGNVSQPVTATVLVDTVGPQFGPLTVNSTLYISRTALLFSTGVVTDGDGVATVQLLVIRPDGSSTIAPALLNGGTWSGSFVFDQTGVYQVMAVATDLAGNKIAQLVGEINALYADIPPARPVITASLTGTLGVNNWYVSHVTVGFTCADMVGGLGIVTNTVTGTVLTVDGADQAVTNSGVCIDNGNNPALSVTVNNIDIDQTPPVVAVTGVSNGASYTLGSVPTAACSTTDATSGVATAATVAVAGGNGDGKGSFTAACSGATDNAGNNTPPVSAGILRGVTRRFVIDTLAPAAGMKVVENPMLLKDVFAADEVFLTGTAAEIIGVSSIDGKQIGSGIVGPLTHKLAADFKKRVQVNAPED